MQSVIAAQYDDIIYMNVWHEKRPQRALFQLLLQLYDKEMPKEKKNYL